MQTISTIGLDIAKSVFQVHGVDAAGQVVVRRQLKRRHAFLSATLRCALPLPLLMLWTAPPPARECQRCGRR